MDVTNLTQPGNEPHDLELDIKTTAEVADADLVLLVHGFQPAVDDAVDEVAEGDVLDVADVVDLKDSTEDAGEKDPHFWQDPARMATLTESVAASLSKLDPDHAATYDANAQALVADLEPARERLRGGAAGLRAGHDRRLARRVHLPRPVRPEGRGDRRPLPRRRADAGRPGPAAGADRDRRDHHRVLRAAGQPAVEPDPGRRHGDHHRRARPHRGVERRDGRRGLPVADAREPRRPRRGERMPRAHERHRTRAARPTAPSRSPAVPSCAGST